MALRSAVLDRRLSSGRSSPSRADACCEQESRLVTARCSSGSNGVATQTRAERLRGMQDLAQAAGSLGENEPLRGILISLACSGL